MFCTTWKIFSVFCHACKHDFLRALSEHGEACVSTHVRIKYDAHLQYMIWKKYGKNVFFSLNKSKEMFNRNNIEAALSLDRVAC